MFGVFLVYTGSKVLRHRPDEGTHGHDRAVSLLKRFMPVSERVDGHQFFTRENAKRAATPLLAALVVVEFTDVIFAVDSVPAVLAVSHEPFLVFAANAFAILGLRAAYFLLAGCEGPPALPRSRAGPRADLRRGEDGRVALVAHPDRDLARRHRRPVDRGGRRVAVRERRLGPPVVEAP